MPAVWHFHARMMLAGDEDDRACWTAQVAVAYGDVRRALELCRKAAEVAEEQCLLPPSAGSDGSLGAATASEAAAAQDPDAPSPPPQPGMLS